LRTAAAHSQRDTEERKKWLESFCDTTQSISKITNTTNLRIIPEEKKKQPPTQKVPIPSAPNPAHENKVKPTKKKINLSQLAKRACWVRKYPESRAGPKAQRNTPLPRVHLGQGGINQAL